MDGKQTMTDRYWKSDAGLSYCYKCHRVSYYPGIGAGMCIDKERHNHIGGWDKLEHAVKNLDENTNV